MQGSDSLKARAQHAVCLGFPRSSKQARKMAGCPALCGRQADINFHLFLPQHKYGRGGMCVGGIGRGKVYMMIYILGACHTFNVAQDPVSL